MHINYRRKNPRPADYRNMSAAAWRQRYEAKRRAKAKSLMEKGRYDDVLMRYRKDVWRSIW